MDNIGVIEGFFGPEWPHPVRLSYAPFLRQHGGKFYIYAPKRDAHLRKAWREDWDEGYQQFLKLMSEYFHSHGIFFGVGFSPFGLGRKLTPEDVLLLERKVSLLGKLGIDMLGLFFDDMPVNDHLAETQLEALGHIQKHFKGKIIFCPSYYTPDPILDKVFGQRPPHYLDTIALKASNEVAMAWTGPKVISPEIDQDHLRETTALLKRKPFLWENLFANDGPKNCKFLKLKPFSGRRNITSEIEGIGLNMMNQGELSKISFLAALNVLNGEEDHEKAFRAALSSLCSKELSEVILNHQEAFLSFGLDQLSPDVKQNLLQELSKLPDPAAREIEDWLEGKYIVGSECLTD